jgi:hypothetical protein
MDQHQSWHRRRLLEQAALALEKNGIPTAVFETSEEALTHIEEAAREAQNVGFGGSMTLSELAVAERLAGRGKDLLDHGRAGLSAEERREIMSRQQGCDLFLTSTNALTVGGHLVNIDATGNRVCAMAFGPKRVLVVAGANKVTMDLESALRRVRETACPPNARRLGFNTPCASTGRCSDCDAPDRICRVTTIIERRPRGTDLQVCLINADLGY